MPDDDHRTHAPAAPRSRVIDVVLADPNPLMLGAISEYVENDPRLSLVGTARSAEGLIEIVLQTGVTVGIMDWTLPQLGGAKVLEMLRARDAAPRMVVYADATGTTVARQAMAAGAAGFCARSEPPERLMDVVEEVADGRMVFPFLDVRDLGRNPLDTLTLQERKLIELLALGRSNKELAAELEVSLNTVKFHLRNIFEKLSVKSRAQAIALYYAAGVGS